MNRTLRLSNRKRFCDAQRTAVLAAIDPNQKRGELRTREGIKERTTPEPGTDARAVEGNLT